MDFDGVDRQPHAVYKTDYTVTIPIAGQAMIDFYVIDGDHHQVANTNMTVPNVKNTQIKQPYVGQLLGARGRGRRAGAREVIARALSVGGRQSRERTFVRRLLSDVTRQRRLHFSAVQACYAAAHRKGSRT